MCCLYLKFGLRSLLQYCDVTTTVFTSEGQKGGRVVEVKNVRREEIEREKWMDKQRERCDISSYKVNDVPVSRLLPHRTTITHPPHHQPHHTHLPYPTKWSGSPQEVVTITRLQDVSLLGTLPPRHHFLLADCTHHLRHR